MTDHYTEFEKEMLKKNILEGKVVLNDYDMKFMEDRIFAVDGQPTADIVNMKLEEDTE